MLSTFTQLFDLCPYHSHGTGSVMVTDEPLRPDPVSFSFILSFTQYTFTEQIMLILLCWALGKQSLLGPFFFLAVALKHSPDCLEGDIRIPPVQSPYNIKQLKLCIHGLRSHCYLLFLKGV